MDRGHIEPGAPIEHLADCALQVCALELLDTRARMSDLRKGDALANEVDRVTPVELALQAEARYRRGREQTRVEGRGRNHAAAAAAADECEREGEGERERQTASRAASGGHSSPAVPGGGAIRVRCHLSSVS